MFRRARYQEFASRNLVESLKQAFAPSFLRRRAQATMAAAGIAGGRITAGAGSNLLGQQAADRNQDATVYVGNLDLQVRTKSGNKPSPKSDFRTNGRRGLRGTHRDKQRWTDLVRARLHVSSSVSAAPWRWEIAR